MNYKHILNVPARTYRYDHRLKWDEATVLAINTHTFSRKMKESIEIGIEKHNAILSRATVKDSTWRALFND